MKDIGSRLKEARERKKLSIQDVAIATKINNKILKSIEEGDTEKLPAKPFLRGFVQSYARYLELSVDDIMKQFLEIQGSTKPKPQITEEEGDSQSSHEQVRNKFELYKKIAYVGATIVAVIFIYFIQKTVSRYEEESKIAKEQQLAVQAQIVPEEGTPAATTEGPANLATTTTTPATTPAPVTAPPPAQVTPPVATTPIVKPVVPVEKPAAPIEKPATPVAVKPAAPVAVTTPVATPAPAIPKPEVKKPAPKSQQIIIEALDNVEIRYAKDGERERTVKLKPEQFLTIKADSKINLNVSDSGAVNIIHNGRDKGVPGSLGQPTKLSYP